MQEMGCKVEEHPTWEGDKAVSILQLQKVEGKIEAWEQDKNKLAEDGSSDHEVYPICTIATASADRELRRLLRSVAHYYPGNPVYVAADNETVEYLEQLRQEKWAKSNLTGLVVKKVLQKYAGQDRQQMNDANEWAQFNMEKATIMEMAMEDGHRSVLYVDSDSFFLQRLPPMEDQLLGLSKQGINRISSETYGLYNSGFLFARDRRVLQDWRNLTYNEPLHDLADQLALTKLAERWPHFDTDQGVNVQGWSMIPELSFEHKAIHGELDCAKGQVVFRKHAVYSMQMHSHNKNEPALVDAKDRVNVVLKKCHHPLFGDLE